MFNLSDQEKGKVQAVAQDKVLIEGLKKVFLGVFLESHEWEVNVLAASMIAVQKLEKGFKVLARMNEEIQDKEIRENIV